MTEPLAEPGSFMFFVTFDDDRLPPHNVEALLIVSAVVWLSSYLIGPARGRPFFLGAGLIGLWFTVLELAENVFDAPFESIAFFAGGLGQELGATGDVIDPTSGFEPRRFDPPDPATIGALSLVFGVGFLLAARALDRRGGHGTATPFAVAAIPCLAVGVAGLADDLEGSGTGLLLTLIGLVLAWHGASVGRRATSWIGGAAMAAGLAIFLAEMAGDDATTGGMLFIAGGIVMVFGGHLLASALNEPDELAVTAGARVANGPMRQVVSEPDPSPATPVEDDDEAWKPPPPS
jgi:hypothetical protein